LALARASPGDNPRDPRASVLGKRGLPPRGLGALESDHVASFTLNTIDEAGRRQRSQWTG